ncbi:MAG TPA: DMT family transporter [Anaerolineaceae bacterium]|nr:DMT family transporter [Anaerolineaceae bacterium]
MSTVAPARSNVTRGYSIAMVSAVILSTTAIFIRYLTQTYHLPALVLAFWRELFVALTLSIILALIRPALLKIRREHLFFLVAFGLVLAAFNGTWTLSVALNGAAVSTVLAYCSTAFTALLGWLFLKERLNWVKLLAVALSLGGCVLVSGAYRSATWQANLLGIFVGILSGLFYGVYSLLGRSASQRGLNPWTTLLYAFGFAAFFLLSLNLLAGGLLAGGAVRPADLFWLRSALAGWGILFLLAAVPTLAGYGLYNVSLSLLPSSVANLIVTSEPVYTVILAYFLFGELLNVIQLGGGLMILSGVVLLRIFEGTAASQTQAELQAKNSVTGLD